MQLARVIGNVVVTGHIDVIGPFVSIHGGDYYTAKYAAADGATLWEKRFNVFHTDIVASRLGWTALTADPET